MMSVFDEYQHLWPQSSHKSLKDLLSQVKIVKYPEDAVYFSKIKKVQQTIVVVEKATVQEIIQILSLGFEHVVQRDRLDFPKELLASSLMCIRPDAFLKNPVPFFFTGFENPQENAFVETNMSASFYKTSDKHYILDKLDLFLSQADHLLAIKELCLQAADEQISNALFSAPVKANGEHPYQEVIRTSEVILPENRKANLFACFSDQRVVIGCEDSFGSIKKHLAMEHLENVYQRTQVKPSEGTGGAGLGLKFMIDNSSNFYLYVEPGKRTIVACAFQLSGMKINLNEKKHFHLSFR